MTNTKEYNLYKQYAKEHKDKNTTEIFKALDYGIRKKEGLKAIREGQNKPIKKHSIIYTPIKYRSVKVKKQIKLIQSKKRIRKDKQPKIEIISFKDSISPKSYYVSKFKDSKGNSYYIKHGDKNKKSLNEQKNIILLTSGSSEKIPLHIKDLKFISSVKHNYRGKLFESD